MCKSLPKQNKTKRKQKKIKKTQLKNLGIFSFEVKPPVLHRASLGGMAQAECSSSDFSTVKILERLIFWLFSNRYNHLFSTKISPRFDLLLVIK